MFAPHVKHVKACTRARAGTAVYSGEPSRESQGCLRMGYLSVINGAKEELVWGLGSSRTFITSQWRETSPSLGWGVISSQWGRGVEA